MDINKDALKELLNTQIESVEGFNMGEDLMKNAVNDIKTLSEAAATLSRTENDDEKHRLEMELLRKKDEREERESETRIKQGWLSAAGTLISGVVAFGMWCVLNVSQAIDEHNGDIRSRSKSNLARSMDNFMIRIFGRKG